MQNSVPANDKHGDILEEIYSQIPGGGQAIANRDPVALQAMASLLETVKHKFLNKNGIPSDIFKKFASSMNARQTKDSNFAVSDDVTGNMMSQLIQAFPNLKGNIPAQKAVLQTLTRSNSKFLEIMKLLRNDQSNKPKNIQNMKFDEIVNMLDDFHLKNRKPRVSVNDFSETHEYVEESDSENDSINDVIMNDRISNEYVAQQPIVSSQSEEANSFEQGEINLHELLRLKNMLDNGASVEHLKKMYHLQPPQLIGRSLLAGEDSKDTTGNTSIL